MTRFGPRLNARSAGFALATVVALLSCRGALSREPGPPVITAERLPVGTARRDTVAADTTFPTMPAPLPRVSNTGRQIRVALGMPGQSVRLSASGAWRLVELDGTPVTAAGGGEVWTLTRDAGRIRASRDGSGFALTVTGPLVARPVEPAAVLTVGSRRYRGELMIHVERQTLLVVNRLPIESYLRGVVPLEIGQRTAAERAAIEAQAIAARTYAYAHLRAPGARSDVVSTVDDQVYGGADAERALSDIAVAATTGLVLRYGGRLASTPYHSTCGGSTAEPSEVWSGESGASYLRRASDRIPGSDRYYCDPSPRFKWTREMSGEAVVAALERYLAARGAGSARGSRVYSVRVTGRTPSGRVGTLVIDDGGDEVRLRGDQIRYALRGRGGELLNSTYFSVETDGDSDGIRKLIMRGGGYGHGVGMCQWGAIGRARAGHDARAILATYYPGTSVGTVD